MTNLQPNKKIFNGELFAKEEYEFFEGEWIKTDDTNLGFHFTHDNIIKIWKWMNYSYKNKWYKPKIILFLEANDECIFCRHDFCPDLYYAGIELLEKCNAIKYWDKKTPLVKLPETEGYYNNALVYNA